MRATLDTVPADSAGFRSVHRDSFGEPRLYLSWHAPYGMPRARDTVTFSGADTNRVDTLYLSCETGQDGPTFLAMFSRLYFHPAWGESLGVYWAYEHGTVHSKDLAVEYDPVGSFPCAQPWQRSGIGNLFFMPDPLGTRMDLYYVMTKAGDAGPISGRTRYCFARVMFRQKHPELPGMHQPVCIEWTVTKFSLGGRDIVGRGGPQRFVSINSPHGRVCQPYRRERSLRGWVPTSGPSPALPVPPQFDVPPATPARPDSR